jgi:glycosyltransferase involved in cell wall biosynthesis
LNIGLVATESPYGPSTAGGIAAYLRAMIPSFLDAGHQVTLFAGAGETRSFLAEHDRLKVHHFRLPSAHWYASKIPVLRNIVTLPLRQIEWSVAFYRRVASIAAREKLDLLECTEAGGLFLNQIAPVVIRLHGSESVFRKYAGLPTDTSVRLNNFLERKICEKASAITTPSVFQAREIAESKGWTMDRFHVIPNPISKAMLEASSEGGLRGDKQEGPLLLYVGRLAQVKGMASLFAAAKEVQATVSGATFVLAGPWQMPLPPKSYGLQLNRRSTNGILWIGAQEPSQLIDWYRRATLFVMPSYFESFGISVVEAMAFGVPVIATTGGALPEIIQDGVTGQLVPPGDPTALAAAILCSLDNSEARQIKSRLARDSVLKNFTAERAAGATLQLYSDIQGSSEIKLKELDREAKAASIGVQA